jgi:transcriptional regulator with XRE-family HTH domain
VEKDVRLPEIQVEYVYKILNGNEVKQKLKAKGLSLKRREHVERLGVKPRHLRRILNQQYPTKLHVIKAIEQFIGSEVSYKKVVTKKHRDIQIPTYLTPELAQIFGYWLGMGPPFIGIQFCSRMNALRFSSITQHCLEKSSTSIQELLNPIRIATS